MNGRLFLRELRLQNDSFEIEVRVIEIMRRMIIIFTDMSPTFVTKIVLLGNFLDHFISLGSNDLFPVIEYAAYSEFRLQFEPSEMRFIRLLT